MRDGSREPPITPARPDARVTKIRVPSGMRGATSARQMTGDTPTIGIDFGGTSVKAGVVVGSRVITTAPALATQDYEGPESLIGAMTASISTLREAHPEVVAVGVGMPGFVDSERGVVRKLTNVRGWTDLPLRARLSEQCGLPVAVDNDANCMAYAEWRVGAGRHFRNLLCVTLGTGVGGGLIVDGRLIHGSRFGAGEIGQMSIDYQGRPGHYQNLGALEDYVGNREIAERACAAYAAAGINQSVENCSPAALATAAGHGDPVALAIWDETARMLACALMGCCWLLNPEAIIIGGGVARAGAVLFDPLETHLFAQLSSPFRDHLQILPAAFCNDAGIIGAASIARDGAPVALA